MPTLEPQSPEPDAVASPARRRLFRHIALVPLAAAGATGLPRGAAQTPPSTAPNSVGSRSEPGSPYRPRFFDAAEWSFLHAACERLIPQDEHGPGAVESGVPEFIDRHMLTPYAAGDIWYTEGPFLDAPSSFGYQGRLPLRDLLRVGIAATDGYCRRAYQGRTFAQLDLSEQTDLLTRLEKGAVALDELSAAVFFGYLLSETRNGYFADPSHGGNRGMGGWKMIGYPGVRADYLDWVSVRDRPYPIPPVDMAGRRG